MTIPESVLEEIFFAHPEEFLPELNLRQYARQLHLGGRRDPSRMDFAFWVEPSESLWLFEAKALGKSKTKVKVRPPGGPEFDVVHQVKRYLDALDELDGAKCECPFPTTPLAGVVAPDIDPAVKAELRAFGIESFEFGEDHFRRVAAKYGISLAPLSADGLQADFWRAFCKYLDTKGSTIGERRVRRGLSRIPVPSVDTNGINVSIGVPHLQLTFRCSPKDNSLDVDLTFARDGYALFPRFCEKRVAIDAELDQIVLWFKGGVERHVRVQRWPDVRDRASWPEHHRWMRRQGEVFIEWARKLDRHRV